MTLEFSEDFHVVTSHAPAADLYNGDPAGQAVALKQFGAVSFFLQQKTAGTNTGTAVVTVEECSAVGGTGNTAIAFKYRKKATGAGVDSWGDWQAATAAGFTTTANEDSIYEIFVDARDLSEDKPYVRLQLTEGADDPVTGAAMAVLYRQRYGGISHPTVVA